MLQTTVGMHYRYAKGMQQGYFFSQEFQPLSLPKAFQSKAGLWNVTPELKVSQSRRAVELNCAEQAFKQSLTLRLDCQHNFIEKMLDNVIGTNYGLNL